MNKNEILLEISIIKHKIASESLGVIQKSELLVAILSLYDSYVKVSEEKDEERNKAA